jgi:hypothetical protein
MKFDDVIVKESFLGDIGNKMFGRQKGGDKSPAPKVMKGISTGGEVTYVDKLAKKLFVADFMSDVVSSIDAGLKSGLIIHPNPVDTGADIKKPYDKYNEPTYKRQGVPEPKLNTAKPGRKIDPKTGKFVQGNQIGRQYAESYISLDKILESIIENNGEISNPGGGRQLHEFLSDWFGQWMTGVELNKSKDVFKEIFDKLQVEYDNSPDPSKPNIDRNILKQLADGAWAISASSPKSTLPKGAENAKGKDEIEASLTTNKVSGKAPRAPAQKPAVQIPVGTQDTMGNRNYVWKGAQWQDVQSKQMAPKEVQQALTQQLVKKQKARRGVGMSTPAKANVAESKTNSAIRAEKIALLKTR